MIWLFVHLFWLCLLSFVLGGLASGVLLVRPLWRRLHAAPVARCERGPVETMPTIEPMIEDRTELAPFVPAEDVSARPRAARTPGFAHRSSPGQLDVVVVVGASTQTGGPAAFDAPPVIVPGARGEQPAENTPETALEPGPYADSALPTDDGAAPDTDHVIKGNTRSMRYHTSESPYFERTKAAVWFRSTTAAEAAGFTAWNERVRVAH